MSAKLANLLEDLLRNRFSEILISVPARIESYDRNNNLASVQPLLNRKANGTSKKRYPVFSNIDCLMYCQNGFVINNNFKAGDMVLLSFSTHSIEQGIHGQYDDITDSPFNPYNAFVINSFISKKNIKPSRNQLLEKEGLIMGHESGDAFIQIKEDQIVFQVGGDDGNKWVLKSDKTEVNKTIEVEEDVIVDSKVTRVSSKKHGHSAPFGPTISKLPAGEA
ncbi:MAG: hypothetical protein GW938_15640 [Leptospira sp.]|nr:hypothetical protein [Leptospira sp.]